jgi:ubiquitin
MSADDQTREDVTTPAPGGDDPEALREQIEQTREGLGDTVEALSAKADVKGQVKEKVDERKAQLRDQQAQAQAKLNEVKGQAQENPTPFAAAAGGLLALLILIGLWRRRR